MHYRGRFAPSPTGPLHIGSLVAAMASFADARAHGGRWLVRIEDIDEARSDPAVAQTILATLEAFGMRSDEEVAWQSRRQTLYAAARAQLSPWVYACGCTRREIADSRLGIAADGAAVYPGTCRSGLAPEKAARAWRLRVPDAGAPNEHIEFEDRWMGRVSQHLATEVGDFVLKRADGFWAYQLAVVADDADQGITHVVRGADLLDSTPRQIYLQRLLGMPTPAYLHVPVVANEDGEKLSKQTGAKALDLADPLGELMKAAVFLGLAIDRPQTVAEFWPRAIAKWGERFGARRSA